MSILTSLLLLVAGVALLILVFRSRPKSRIRRLEEWEQDRLEIGSNICHAAARDAFDLSLDGSLSSLETIDHMIEQGWPIAATNSEPAPPSNEVGLDDNQPSEQPAEPKTEALAIPDEQYVIGCYVGTAIVKHLNGEWRTDTELHRWPYVYFSRADLAVSPFELVQKKFEGPQQFMLTDAVERLTGDIDRRTNIRGTSWHNAGEERVSFGEPTEHTE